MRAPLILLSLLLCTAAMPAAAQDKTAPASGSQPKGYYGQGEVVRPESSRTKPGDVEAGRAHTNTEIFILRSPAKAVGGAHPNQDAPAK